MSTSIETGLNITTAVRVLRDTNADVERFFYSLDERLSHKSLRPSERSKVLADSPRSLGDANRWMTTTMYRAYAVPDIQNAEKFLAIEIHLAPRHRDYPILLALGVRTATAVPVKKIWDGWKRDFLDAWQSTSDDGSLANADIQLAQQSFPGASTARGFTHPLCSLDFDNLQDKVVLPAVKLLEEL